MCSFASAHAGLRRDRAPAGVLLAPLRIGLHSGFVMADASDFYGRNVVLAARIADHAQPGEILVSAGSCATRRATAHRAGGGPWCSPVSRHTSGDPSFEFEPRGEQHFKGHLLGEHPRIRVSWS